MRWFQNTNSSTYNKFSKLTQTGKKQYCYTFCKLKEHFKIK